MGGKMSFAIRNSIILLVVLAAINAGGWGYMYITQIQNIDKLQNDLAVENQTLVKYRAIVNQYDNTYKKYKAADNKLKNYYKILPSPLDADDIYGFLSRISTNNAYTDINFTLIDSTIHNNYGVIKVGINGKGYYGYLYNLLHSIENSKPINKVNKLIIEPVSSGGENKVHFTFELDSYYNRTADFKNTSLTINRNYNEDNFNPFYPLIRSIEPNTKKLPNIDESRLISVSKEVAYLVDQNGKIRNVKIGDEVYLGSLQSINMENKTATFYLNKGGIIDKITLEVQ
jgi:hypothetical protein